jgi:hypothetical protein
MTNYTITPSGSISTSGAGQHAFFRDSSGPDVLVVQQDAFLTTAGSGSAGVRLANTGSWAVTVEGLVFASQYIGMDLDAGNTGASTVTIGAEGGIGGSIGLLIGSAAAIQNAGTISGTSGLAISLGGTGSHSVTNRGVINGSITTNGQANVDAVTNAGTITGSVALGAGSDTFANFRTIGDAVVNGTVDGTINLGAGNDRIRGGVNSETVQDGDGTDNVALGVGTDTYLARGASADGDGTDTVSGGSGIDIYDASGASKRVIINLDTVTHSLGLYAPNGDAMAGGRAQGADVSNAVFDNISGFEAARGGNSADVLYGSGTANALDGEGGNDWLRGYGGDDRLDGDGGLDALLGGRGRDLLIGGAESDSFCFTSATDSGPTSITRDTILDFQDNLDRIDLRFIDAKVGSSSDDVFAFIGTNVAFTGQSGQLRSVWTAQGQKLEGDTDGDRDADFSVGIMDAVHTVQLGVADFLL